jgi:hypothetical protein
MNCQILPSRRSFRSSPASPNSGEPENLHVAQPESRTGEKSGLESAVDRQAARPKGRVWPAPSPFPVPRPTETGWANGEPPHARFIQMRDDDLKPAGASHIVRPMAHAARSSPISLTA